MGCHQHTGSKKGAQLAGPCHAECVTLNASLQKRKKTRYSQVASSVPLVLRSWQHCHQPSVPAVWQGHVASFLKPPLELQQASTEDWGVRSPHLGGGPGRRGQDWLSGDLHMINSEATCGMPNNQASTGGCNCIMHIAIYSRMRPTHKCHR